MKDQHFRSMDELIASIAGMSIEELANEPTEDGRHLITVDELRAAGALDVPAAWRKSLGAEREPDLFANQDAAQEKQEPSPSGSDGETSADEPLTDGAPEMGQGTPST